MYKTVKVTYRDAGAQTTCEFCVNNALTRA